MDIKNQILEFAKKYSLKENALASIDKAIDVSIESNNEDGIDILAGNNKDELIYEFGRFGFHVDGNGNSKIITRIKIYSKKLYGSNIDVPVGYYEEWTGLDGEHLDEFLSFNWSSRGLYVDYYIERINKIVPQKYFRRNVPEYEFVSYINHLISLFQGRQFDVAILFIKRSLVYLEKARNKKIEEEYLRVCLELFEGVYHFVKNENLVETEKLDKYKIYERIKSQQQIIAKNCR
ncbi:hypothetical protein [Flammeovirga aprica]|uniref:Uncharacterized protein n=1 Tax=Flammeovirga aprica JL-4 TaxID=694437 RepID=A0A7X9S0D5_9BACT|nr:hypothetical protein [Flammeovirga aprica]NME72019.1 hypothetical protein [Flammeovirga aprica JL-4]